MLLKKGKAQILERELAIYNINGSNRLMVEAAVLDAPSGKRLN
jgi:hypothetical protein